MAWKKPYRASASSRAVVGWNVELCASVALPERLSALAAAKWLVKFVFWDGVEPGTLTIVSMQSERYAKAGKKAQGDDEESLAG